MFTRNIPNSYIKMITALATILLISLACSSGTSPTRVVQGDTPSSNDTAEVISASEPAPTIRFTSAHTRLPSFTSTATPSPLGNATIIASSCNLRAGPSTIYQIVGNAKSGEIYPVFGRDVNSEWIVLDQNASVWIAASLVRLDVDIASLPDVEYSAFEIASEPSATSIPVITSMPVTTVLPTPLISNGQINVFNISTFRTTDGGLYVMGEVLNTGDAVLMYIEVTIKLFDSEGRLLDTEWSYVYLPWQNNLWETGVLYARDRAPFKIIFTDPGNWSSYEVEVEYDEADYDNYSDHYNAFQILNDVGRNIDDIFYNYQVSGEIQNIGDSSCGNIWIIVTLYNSNGEVVGVDEVRTDVELLSPGGIEPFEVQVYTRGPVAYYSLLLDAIRH